MKTLVIGNGAREHAIIKACLRSPLVSEVIAAPGNGGIEQEVRCKAVKPDDIDGLVKLAIEEAIEFVIVGPELPLSLGITDKLQAHNILVYGPNLKAAQLESSKVFTKNFLQKCNIPTAIGQSFVDSVKAIEYLKTQNFPIVVKASGLAAGKGVIIAQNFPEAQAAVKDMLEEGKFGEGGEEILIEQFLEGEEASIMLIVSGGNYRILPASQDHKRIGENDTGLNTGGMGAYAPADIVTPELKACIKGEIIEPTLAGLLEESIDFRGTLYIGLMLTASGPSVLEFNVRFGDPETQVLLPLLEEDAIELFLASAQGSLETRDTTIKKGYALCVVHAAGGYPESYKKGDAIVVPGTTSLDTEIYHAGTQLKEDQLITNGGRVLTVTGFGKMLDEAAEKAYELSEKVCFNNSYYRKDIGSKQLLRECTAAL